MINRGGADHKKQKKNTRKPPSNAKEGVRIYTES